jgi:hypothetical protein
MMPPRALDSAAPDEPVAIPEPSSFVPFLRFSRNGCRAAPFPVRRNQPDKEGRMAKTTADFMLERLSAWGVTHIYGFPGDGISSTLEALGKAMDRFTFVQARHEEEAAFMACAHAKWTGTPGVCLATSGPGAIHLLNGLYDAKLDHQPVLAIVGQQDRAALGGSYQQEVDLLTLFKDVAHNYVHYCQTPVQMRHLVDRACASPRPSAASRRSSCPTTSAWSRRSSSRRTSTAPSTPASATRPNPGSCLPSRTSAARPRS